MIINLSPRRYDIPLSVSTAGDVLTINGDVFDFTPLPDGATLPLEAIGSDYFAGPVERINGELNLTLLLPHGATQQHVAFPEPIHVTENGPVKLPTDSVEVENVD